MLPIQGYVVLPDDMAKQDALIAGLKSDLKIALDKGAETTKALLSSVDREKALQARVDVLTKPPVTTKITRTTLPRFGGLTIEKSISSPSTTLYSQVKTAMRWGQSMGLTYWRGFFNPTEVAEHVGLRVSTLGNLADYGRTLGLGFIADTVDSDGIQALDNAAFKAYIQGLIKMGAEGVFINDADRLAIDVLKSMVARIRGVSQEMPIFVSLMGSANIEFYKSIVDHVEIQTFGTTEELVSFLKKDAIMCLDLRKPLTSADIQARTQIALKMPPKAFFLYADLPTDYDAMPDEEDLIVRGFVSAWKTTA